MSAQPGSKVQALRLEVQTRALLYPPRQRSMLLHELELEGRAPARRTFYAWIHGLTPSTGGEQWSVLTDSTGRPDLVFRALTALYSASDGRLSSITTDEARIIVAVALAKPTLLEETGPFTPAGLAPWLWAQRYLRAKPEEYSAIDLELAAP
jgi:hypothetical protein